MYHGVPVYRRAGFPLIRLPQRGSRGTGLMRRPVSASIPNANTIPSQKSRGKSLTRLMHKLLIGGVYPHLLRVNTALTLSTCVAVLYTAVPDNPVPAGMEILVVLSILNTPDPKVLPL